ncbi:hypothetical protein PHYBOEH_009329 [Phytophthora boehmeriae]|uniref:Elicitin n=1 Tax=Phytophthora boehmeriae TaxID=109152 RepID=A0A8T1VU59_9STRA|nr:hypothetical protein PHYBOEH_009329 [Phytophthora boehmeriae]
MRILPALLYLALNANGAVEAATCKTLLDSTSTLATSIASWTNTSLSSIDFATTFKEIDTNWPWFSKCAANLDPKSIYTSLASSDKVNTCISTLSSFEANLGTNEGWKSFCPVVKDTIVPCVNSAMTDTIMDAFTNAGGCCDDMLSEIKTLFGDSLDDMVEKLAKISTNVMCTERTFTNLAKAKTTELCGYSEVHSFFFIDDDTDATVFLNLLQIPNDQMCNAFEGKAFTTTNGSSVTIGFGTKGIDTMGICLQPIDTLIQYLASWPIFSKTLDASGTSITLSDLFTKGKSIKADLLLSYLSTSTNLPMIVLRTMDKVMTALFGSGSDDDNEDATSLEDSFVAMMNYIKPDAAALSVHIANNGGCSYSDQSATEVYSSSNISATTTSAAVSLTKLPAFTTGATVLIASLLASGLF